MLVYANSFRFEPTEGPEQIIQLVAKWVGQRSKSHINSTRLAEGIRELKLKDGSTLSSTVTLTDDGRKIYPHLFCAQLSHRDDKVSGRRWVTEIGLQQDCEESPVECSLLLRTEEISARVNAPIRVTRPKLVEQLIVSCQPLGQTPGLKVKKLTVESARAFPHEIERSGRDYPVVIVSPDDDGRYSVEPERLRSILVGLADLVCVPPSENTYEIEEAIGRDYIAFGGAIKIVFPIRNGDGDRSCESVLLRPDELADVIEGGGTVESEVLAAITHRTNLPRSWKHISPEKVGQAVLRAQLARTIEKAKASDRSADLADYIALLEAADDELLSKEIQLSELRSEYETKDQQARKLQAEIDGLKHALSGLRSGDEGQHAAAEALAPLRDCVASVLRGNPTLQQAVDLVSTLYPDRVIFLDSARASAKESDRGGFRQGEKACELLQKLATEYWEHLATGRGDQQAKAVFGQNAYAASESDSLSNDGRRRRTFTYRGRELLMEKHLKHGVKDSVAETLRVHFDWLPNDKKIVIGHCGKHLDF